MYAARTPTLRKSIKDPRTGQLHQRKTTAHLSKPEADKKKPNTPKSSYSAKTTPSKPIGKSQTPPKMPSAETQTTNKGTEGFRDDELHQKLDALVGRFDEIEKTSSEYKQSLEFTQEEIQDLKDENTALKKTLKDMSLEIQRNTYAIQGLGAKQENLDANARKRNLVFEGVPELLEQGGRENLHNTVCKLLAEMGIAKPMEYDAAYRIGSKPGKFPRPLLVSFMRQDDRNLVYAKRTQLRNSPHLHKVWVSEDVSPKTRRFRGVIREVAKEARSQGARCVATPVSVTINNRKYTETNIDDLPAEFAIEKTKMKKMGDTIAYRSEHAPFSNLYPAKVPIGKHRYLSSEQAFRHIRATDNNNPNVAARILWSRDPYDMMDYDKDLVITESWKEKEDFVLFKCIFRKYEANEELRDLIVSTGDLELAEATKNAKWATGATINSTTMKTHSWTGENRQGKHSMKVREYFKLNMDEYLGVKNPEPVSDSFLEHLYKEG